MYSRKRFVVGGGWHCHRTVAAVDVPGDADLWLSCTADGDPYEVSNGIHPACRWQAGCVSAQHRQHDSTMEGTAWSARLADVYLLQRNGFLFLFFTVSDGSLCGVRLSRLLLGCALLRL